MKPITRFVYVYLVPLAILAALALTLHWIPVQMTLEWLVPLAAEVLPATIPPLQIILVLGLMVGGLFAALLLGMTRRLHRWVISRQRLRVLEDKRKRGHDSIAASVFDLSAIALDEDTLPPGNVDAGCALELDARLAMLICTLWAKPEFHKFLQRLFDADAGRGEVLAPEVRQELMFLRKLYVDQKRVFATPLHAARARRVPRARTKSADLRSAVC